jgi:hypothetical protein
VTFFALHASSLCIVASCIIFLATRSDMQKYRSPVLSLHKKIKCQTLVDLPSDLLVIFHNVLVKDLKDRPMYFERVIASNLM